MDTRGKTSTMRILLNTSPRASATAERLWVSKDIRDDARCLKKS